jgi:hypothetical protein
LPVKKMFDGIEGIATWPFKKFIGWAWPIVKQKITESHKKWPWPTRITLAVSGLLLVWFVGASFYYNPW